MCGQRDTEFELSEFGLPQHVGHTAKETAEGSVTASEYGVDTKKAIKLRTEEEVFRDFEEFQYQGLPRIFSSMIFWFTKAVLSARRDAGLKNHIPHSPVSTSLYVMQYPIWVSKSPQLRRELCDASYANTVCSPGESPAPPASSICPVEKEM